MHKEASSSKLAHCVLNQPVNAVEPKWWFSFLEPDPIIKLLAFGSQQAQFKIQLCLLEINVISWVTEIKDTIMFILSSIFIHCDTARLAGLDLSKKSSSVILLFQCFGFLKQNPGLHCLQSSKFLSPFT